MNECESDASMDIRATLRSVVEKGVRVAAAVGLVAAVACSGDSDADPTAVAPDDRCDLVFNTDTFNQANAQAGHHAHDMTAPVDFTVQEWAEVFAGDEMEPSEVVDEIATVPYDIYRRHILAGVLTHQLGPDHWMPMTIQEQCTTLEGELDMARRAAAQYPTVANALAGGYTQGDSYYAGLGAHYQNFDGTIAEFDPAKPAQLLYDGTDSGSKLVGLSYVVALEGDTPPEGFTGSNDQWHRHQKWCMDPEQGNISLAADVLTDAECAELGGRVLINPDLWMLHSWVVPGMENDWGLFASAHPGLPYKAGDESFVPQPSTGN
ncbi:MAG TPA: hypothetical protein VK694_04380 [Verrucomicrobiae bacterium]|nr:hypothetical protein [Verrucomicrobiae bacterium]